MSQKNTNQNAARNAGQTELPTTSGAIDICREVFAAKEKYDGNWADKIDAALMKAGYEVTGTASDLANNGDTHIVATVAMNLREYAIRVDDGKNWTAEEITMDITGHNLPESCYGLGIEKLIALWIDLERAQIAAGLHSAAATTKMMRRQLQEAADLVSDPNFL